MNNDQYHISVLTNEVLEYLDPQPGKTYLDVTFGGGGHTRAILRAQPGCRVIATDWDMNAIEHNGPGCEEEFGERLTLIWSSFATLSMTLKKKGIKTVDGIIADFGTSQHQIFERPGFSFAVDSPLDMRMSAAHHKVTAADMVNSASEKELLYILQTYGEEPHARRIVRAIDEARREKRIEKTRELAAIIEKVIPRRGHGPHPATRTFQALRIAVNHELDEIEALMRQIPNLVAPGGRIVCISFHSLEDRIVKQSFAERRDIYEILTKKPVMGTEQEISRNPSARSARLRAAQRR